jgi:Flp pilus assembly protein TadG
MMLGSLNAAKRAVQLAKNRGGADPRRGSAARRRWSLAAAGFIAARRGAAVVEFAFAAPVLLLAMLGIMDFGYLLWNRHSLELATEESGRMVLTQQTIADDAIIADLKSRILNIDTGAVTASVVRETIGATTFVTINASYTYPFLFAGFLGVDPVLISTKTRVPLRQTD